MGKQLRKITRNRPDYLLGKTVIPVADNSPWTRGVIRELYWGWRERCWRAYVYLPGGAYIPYAPGSKLREFKDEIDVRISDVRRVE